MNPNVAGKELHMQSATQARQGQTEGQEEISWEASVSSWIDSEGEIRPEELDSNPDLAIKPSDLFYARISKAIDAEPHLVAPRLGRHSPLRMGLSGLAVAAAVASVVWVAMPYLTDNEAPADIQVLASTNEDTGLGDYLEAHREIVGASPVRRASFEVSR
jgi:sigma-E factor negative regulatory protein RseA